MTKHETKLQQLLRTILAGIVLLLVLPLLIVWGAMAGVAKLFEKGR